MMLILNWIRSLFRNEQPKAEPVVVVVSTEQQPPRDIYEDLEEQWMDIR